MAVQGVGRRYAEAVFDLASTPAQQDSWLTALRSLASAVEDNETRAFFENPGVPEQRKEQALEAVLPGPENEEVRNLVRLLIHRQRFDQIPNIREAFEAMVLHSRGIAIADVTTAVPLTAHERQAVSARLANIVGSQIQVREHVDQAIIGGIVARVGDQLIDGSVRTQLRELRATLGRS